MMTIDSIKRFKAAMDLGFSTPNGMAAEMREVYLDRVDEVSEALIRIVNQNCPGAICQKQTLRKIR